MELKIVFKREKADVAIAVSDSSKRDMLMNLVRAIAKSDAKNRRNQVRRGRPKKTQFGHNGIKYKVSTSIIAKR